MNVFHKTYYALSSYTDAKEREVGKFFTKLHEGVEPDSVRSELLGLLQKNIIVLNLWSEYKYRQYKYLKKPLRKSLYENAEKIKKDFSNFQKSNDLTWQEVAKTIHKAGVDYHHFEQEKEKVLYIAAIMDYLSPHKGRYIYRKSSTFGALLKDPSKDKLVGDCNQIVTLYLYLYSQKYDLTDLQLRTFPGHVALNFNGIDIEATSASFVKYKEPEQALLPVEEIVGINLLDVSDEYFKTHAVSAVATLESARIAYVVSSQHSVVEKNLAIAYNNAVVEMIQEKSYKKALDYAKDSGDKNLMNMVGSNATLYYLKNNQFKTALDFAYYSDERKNLEHIIYQNKGAYYFNKGDFHGALSAFEKIGDTGSVKNCYIALFNQEQKKLGNISTTDDIKNNSKAIYAMDDYAKKSGSQNLMGYVDNLKKYL